ncbi:MAG TPA: response regulator transcription factor [Candidatus Saccharibacteria bacterium]|nr:response regulator transcription factor [Candidatus Saccharibacteria bacterium]
MKLLIVGSNERLAERIKRHVGKEFLVDIVPSTNDVLEKLTNIDYAVTIFDTSILIKDKLTCCQHIRASGITSPILMIASSDTMENCVDFLNAGADDYLKKPLENDELRARILALSRRQPMRLAPQPTKHLDLIIDSEKRHVFRNGKPIHLRRKEFDILEYLVANRGRVLTREMIMNHAWDSHKSSWPSTVDVHIKHLRDKVDQPFKKKLIKTTYGIGYHIELPDAPSAF